MKVLLDTHVFFWALVAPDRLSNAAQSAIEDPASELIVSAVSAWELATKHRIGKLEAAGPIVLTYERQVADLGAQQLSVSTSHALLAGTLDWDHREPFGRLLAAQSMAEGIPLITKDSAFATLPGIHTIW